MPDEIGVMNAELVVVSLVGKNVDYTELFEGLIENGVTLPVVTISTKSESDTYDRFYKAEQFHRVLRPVTGRRILEVCKAIIAGGNYEECEDLIKEEAEKQHILVVDDNAMVLRSIKGILESDYSVSVVPSGVHAFISIGKRCRI